LHQVALALEAVRVLLAQNCALLRLRALADMPCYSEL
jgi:hypothetical protein